MKTATAEAARATTRPKHLGKIAIARVVKRALERDGRKLTAIANDFRTDAQNVSRWGLEHEPNSPRADHVISAAGTASHGIAVDVHTAIGDELGRQSIPRVAVVHESNVARLSALTVECTDVPRAFAVALADGELSDEEIEALRLQGRESVAAVLELDAYLTREQQKRRKVGA